jgi:Leucine-rich repeat (LRR) protein
MTYLLTCLVILSLNFVEIMSECENTTMIKYIVNHEEFEDTIITTLADWKGFKVNLQQNRVICNKIFNISHRHNIVSLTGSEVTHVETEFLKNQETVQVVKITETKIQTIRKHTFHHLEVNHLILDKNQISIIEEEAFFNLPLLDAIQINGNRLSVLNSDCFKYLPRMATFHAEHNKIKSLKNSFFQIIKQDKGYVNLNYNELNVLKNFFAGLSAENTSVTLAVNQIKELPVGIFDGYSFYSLDLSHNLITDISEELLQVCVRIHIIWFDKNVFNGATLRRLQNWSRRNSVKVNYFPNALIRNGAAGKFLSFAVTAAVFGVVMLSINI